MNISNIKEEKIGDNTYKIYIGECVMFVEIKKENDDVSFVIKQDTAGSGVGMEKLYEYVRYQIVPRYITGKK